MLTFGFPFINFHLLRLFQYNSMTAYKQGILYSLVIMSLLEGSYCFHCKQVFSGLFSGVCCSQSHNPVYFVFISTYLGFLYWIKNHFIVTYSFWDDRFFCVLQVTDRQSLRRWSCLGATQHCLWNTRKHWDQFLFLRVAQYHMANIIWLVSGGNTAPHSTVCPSAGYC